MGQVESSNAAPTVSAHALFPPASAPPRVTPDLQSPCPLAPAHQLGSAQCRELRQICSPESKTPNVCAIAVTAINAPTTTPRVAPTPAAVPAAPVASVPAVAQASNWSPPNLELAAAQQAQNPWGFGL